MENPDFFKNLSEEDMTSLMGMFNKIMNTNVDPEELEKNSEDQSATQYAGLFPESEALLDSPVEMVFTITCNVLNKNQKGEIQSSDKVLIKTYHVPLDNKQQVERYIEGFFNKFHDKMEEQASETLEETSNE